MTGTELRQLLLTKWGVSYDVQLRRIQSKVFLLVMWKYLEQTSFPLTETEYLEHLNGICSYLEAWGCTEQVRHFLDTNRERPRVGKAVSIPLDLGERASEWILNNL